MKFSIAIIILGFKKKHHISIHNSISLTKNIKKTFKNVDFCIFLVAKFSYIWIVTLATP
jgi:hypothetical protein